MLYDECERRYASANRHWQNCAQCSAAGGEGGELDKMCQVGRALTISWENAEKRYAKKEEAQ